MHQSYIPQCTNPVSNNASFYNKNMHMRVLWDIRLMRREICETGLLAFCIVMLETPRSLSN